MAWPHGVDRGLERVPARLGLVLGMAAMLVIPGLRAARADGTCTDVVQLDGGGELRGAVLGRTAAGGVQVAVRRVWLRGRQTPAVARLEAEDRRLVAAARADLIGRIERRLADGSPGTAAVTDFLRRELARLRAGRDDDAEFAVLDVPPRQVRRVRPAAPAAARLARWGWHDGLDDVESLAPGRLRAALIEAGVDPDAEPPALVDRLPARPQNDREWQARMSLVEDALGTPVVFQGVGDTVVRVPAGGATPVDLVGLVAQLLGGDAGRRDGSGGLLGGILADLLATDLPPGPDRWLESARAAASEGRFRATRVAPDAAGGRATVESVFATRLADGSWVTVWRDARVASADDAPPGATARILDDPRIRPLLEGLRAVGIVDATIIDRAVAVGAATLAAQEASDARFAELRGAVVRRLDVPHLDLPPP
jgi:hypothetical protein